MKRSHARILVTLSLLALLAGQLHAAPLSTAFSFQGKLDIGTNAANGSFDLKFTLYDALDGGSIVGTARTNTAVAIANGFYSVVLDFGSGAFPGTARWLEMGVRSNGSGGDFTTLSPRQELTPTPYAQYAANSAASNLVGTLVSGALAGTYSGAVTFNNPGNSFRGNGSLLTSLDAGNISSGFLSDARIPSSIARDSEVFSLVLGSDGSGSGLDADLLDGQHGSVFWKLAGNGGTTPGTDFLGTTDNQALEFKVNNARAFRLEPNAEGAPNVIGGSPRNFVGTGIIGATIGGGGATNYYGAPYTNTVLADFGVVGGGVNNTIQTDSWEATIAGGVNNTIQVNAGVASIGGGANNDIGTNSQYSSIGGGYWNAIRSSADTATISGGDNNIIAANSHDSTIAGGRMNDIGTNAFDSVIGGGHDNNIAANSQVSTIAGGRYNDIGTNSSFSAIGGGYDNNIATDSMYSTIAGGHYNDIGTSSDSSAIGGGLDNNIATDSMYSTIAGGALNDIGTNADHTAIGGGYDNNIQTNAQYATIPGGKEALASNYGQQAYASGQFAANGDAQGSLFVVRRTTVGAVTSELFLDGDGGGRRMVVPVNTVWKFDILVVAFNSAHTKFGGYTVRGHIYNTGGVCALLGASVTTDFESDVNWNVTVAADNVNKALVVSGTGAAGDTIRWVATVRTAEVTY